jgi:dihydropteroate synthase
MEQKFSTKEYDCFQDDRMENKADFSVMGIVNVTPDSFSDGGRYFSTEKALDHALKLADEGANIIDIGGQSTRPGAVEIDIEEECRRVIPVVEGFVRQSEIPVSVDTFNSETARRVLDAGASWINDVSAGLFDNQMPGVVVNYKCKVVLMHTRERPDRMQDQPFYVDVVNEVKRELTHRVDVFIKAGFRQADIIVDPGIGFSKRFEDNILLLSSMEEIVSMGFPVCLGVSRKSFIGKILDRPPEERLYGSLASIVPAYKAGVRIFRVHDVKETVQFLKVLSKIPERKKDL